MDDFQIKRFTPKHGRMGRPLDQNYLRPGNQPGHKAGVGDLHQISRSGDQENRRLDIFKLLPGHHGRIAEQGSELLMTEKT